MVKKRAGKGIIGEWGRMVGEWRFNAAKEL
jgi:hypothetical protein